jgi:hypothetical protein
MASESYQRRKPIGRGSIECIEADEWIIAAIGGSDYDPIRTKINT